MSRTYRKSKISNRHKNLESFEDYLVRTSNRWKLYESQYYNNLVEMYTPGVETTRDWFAFFRDGGKKKYFEYFYPNRKIINHRQRRRHTKNYLSEVKKDIDKWYGDDVDRKHYWFTDYYD